jgi:3-oxoacyl-[acyl-carrier protein] reductase
MEACSRPGCPGQAACHDGAVHAATEAERAALVTGVGRADGIGAAIARRLARHGWDLALNYWHPYDERIGLPFAGDDTEALAEELRSAGRRVEVLPGDLADRTVPAALVARAGAALGPLSGLVLSHCESVDHTLLGTTVAALEQHLSVNVIASWQLIAAFAQQVQGSDGRIVALTSDHVVGNVPYGASKAALERIIVAAAFELGPAGIRANAINPGPTDTGWMAAEQLAALAEQAPLGRVSLPDDAAALTAFLMSPDGAWMTGQILTSDGGFASR